MIQDVNPGHGAIGLVQETEDLKLKVCHRGHLSGSILGREEGGGLMERERGLLYEGCLRWLQWSLGGKELLRNGIDVRIHNRFLKIGKLRVKQEERKGLKNGVLLILGQGKVHKKPPF